MGVIDFPFWIESRERCFACAASNSDVHSKNRVALALAPVVVASVVVVIVFVLGFARVARVACLAFAHVIALGGTLVGMPARTLSVSALTRLLLVALALSTVALALAVGLAVQQRHSIDRLRTDVATAQSAADEAQSAADDAASKADEIASDLDTATNDISDLDSRVSDLENP